MGMGIFFLFLVGRVALLKYLHWICSVLGQSANALYLSEISLVGLSSWLYHQLVCVSCKEIHIYPNSIPTHVLVSIVTVFVTYM